jgi:hypothetical protein
MLAFVGEICWGIQMGWALRVIARNLPLRGSPTIQVAIRKVVPMVGYLVPFCAILGNIMSVTGMITTNYIFPTIEESVWGILFLTGAISSVILWHFGCDSWSFDYGSNCFGYDINPFDDPNKEEPYDPPSLWTLRMYVRFFALFGIAATPYMILVDVP